MERRVGKHGGGLIKDIAGVNAKSTCAVAASKADNKLNPSKVYGGIVRMPGQRSVNRAAPLYYLHSSKLGELLNS